MNLQITQILIIFGALILNSNSLFLNRKTTNTNTNKLDQDKIFAIDDEELGFGVNRTELFGNVDAVVLECPTGSGINILEVQVDGKPNFDLENDMDPCLIDDSLRSLNKICQFKEKCTVERNNTNTVCNGNFLYKEIVYTCMRPNGQNDNTNRTVAIAMENNEINNFTNDNTSNLIIKLKEILQHLEKKVNSTKPC